MSVVAYVLSSQGHQIMPAQIYITIYCLREGEKFYTADMCACVSLDIPLTGSYVSINAASVTSK